jgi:hypothetical protein
MRWTLTLYLAAGVFAALAPVAAPIARRPWPEGFPAGRPRGTVRR